MLNVPLLRARFPALNRLVDEQPVAYFDGPGGTQVPTEVADAVRDYLLGHNANSGWNYPTSHETDEIVDDARAAMADFFGGAPDEVAFGANMTTLTLRVAQALGRELGPGDRVVVTELDHHANVDPWKAMARDRDAEVRAIRMDPDTGTLDHADLDDALADGTRVLAIGAASNALGTITDLAPVIERARDLGATVFVDAVHYAPHALLDVRALDAGFVAVSPYKFYGPHAGVIWGRKDRIASLDLPRVESAPDYAPDRLETGTASFEAMAGVTAAVDFIASLAGDDAGSRRDRLAATFDALHQRGAALFERLWLGLSTVPGVRLFGPPPGEPRTPTLGFAIDGVPARDAAGALADRGLFLSHGDFYATTVARRLGHAEQGLLRAGCMAYTTEEEVDRLVEGVAGLEG